MLVSNRKNLYKNLKHFYEVNWNLLWQKNIEISKRLEKGLDVVWIELRDLQK
jgi:hypothetical protein